MRRLAAVLFVSSLMLAWNTTVACAGMYVSGSLGAVEVEDSDVTYEYDSYDSDEEISFDNGIGLTAAFGYAWDNGFRVEGEIGGRFNEMDEVSTRYGSASIDDVSVSSASFMGNVYYNLMPENFVSPFIGAGIGFAVIEADTDYDDYDYYDYYYYEDYDDEEYDTVLAYQLAAGLTFSINKHFKIDAQYRYFKTDDPDFDNIEIEYSTHNAMVGLRYNF